MGFLEILNRLNAANADGNGLPRGTWEIILPQSAEEIHAARFRSTPLQTVRQITPDEEAVFEKAWEDCDTPAIVRREE